MTKQEEKIKMLEAALKERIWERLWLSRGLKERKLMDTLVRQHYDIKMRQSEGEVAALRANNEVLRKEIAALRDERDWLVANGLKTGKEHDRLRTEYTKLALTWNAFQAARRDGGREIAMAEARGQLAYEFAKKLLAMNGLDLDSMQLPRREYPDGRG